MYTKVMYYTGYISFAAINIIVSAIRTCVMLQSICSVLEVSGIFFAQICYIQTLYRKVHSQYNQCIVPQLQGHHIPRSRPYFLPDGSRHRGRAGTPLGLLPMSEAKEKRRNDAQKTLDGTQSLCRSSDYSEGLHRIQFHCRAQQ